MLKSKIVLLVCSAAALALAGCDNGPSAVAQKQAAGTQMANDVGEASDARDRADGAHDRDRT